MTHNPALTLRAEQLSTASRLLSPILKFTRHLVGYSSFGFSQSPDGVVIDASDGSTVIRVRFHHPENTSEQTIPPFRISADPFSEWSYRLPPTDSMELTAARSKVIVTNEDHTIRSSFLRVEGHQPPTFFLPTGRPVFHTDSARLAHAIAACVPMLPEPSIPSILSHLAIDTPNPQTLMTICTNGTGMAIGTLRASNADDSFLDIAPSATLLFSPLVLSLFQRVLHHPGFADGHVRAWATEQLFLEVSSNTADVWIQAPLPVGAYPNYMAIIPTPADMAGEATLDASILQAILRRIQPFPDSRSDAVDIEFSPSSFSISARSPEAGETVESVATITTFTEPVHRRIKLGYLRSAISHAEGLTNISVPTKPEKPIHLGTILSREDSIDAYIMGMRM